MYIKEVLEITCYNSPTFLTPGKYAVEICPKFCCWATGSARICPLYCLCEFITSEKKIGPIILVTLIEKYIPVLISCKKALCMNVGIIS